MAWPPDPLDADFDNDSLTREPGQTGTDVGPHPQHHNDLAAAVNELVAHVDGLFAVVADRTAREALSAPTGALVFQEDSGQLWVWAGFWSLVHTALPPLLAEFDVLVRARSFAGVDGDPWLNEGTAGTDYDALTGGANEPFYVTSPEPGFEIPGDSSAYYNVPNGAGIEPGAGSFTVFARTYWPAAAGADGNICAKITGTPTVDFAGFRMASGDNWGTITIALIGNGTTDLTYAFLPGNLGIGEHLLVMRVDRDTDDIDIFVDGVQGTTGDASVIPDVTCNHEWIFGRGKAQTNRDYGFIKRALTDDEITSGLLTALGV